MKTSNRFSFYVIKTTLFAALSLSLLSYSVCSEEKIKTTFQYLPYESELCLFKRECIYLEVADTKKEQSIGLMYRNKLSRMRGMYFPINPARKVRFWMYKMLIPLDMIFLSKGKVIAIEHKAKVCISLPCRTYGPAHPVDGVVELAAGEAKRLRIKLGEVIKINPIENSLY